MPHKNIHIKGFSLLEISVAIVLLSLLAGIGIPKYIAYIDKGLEREAVNQLLSIHAINQIYKANAGSYFKISQACQPSECDLLDSQSLEVQEPKVYNFNQNFGTNLIANQKYIYQYDEPGVGADTFTAKIKFRLSNGNDIKIRVAQEAISSTSTPPNPCCEEGECFTLDDCNL
ncbi:MAG: type II secretion system protein [Candidatus Omnitrophica bacterium]|nr:type II secretion system protein [Candidatus Omnitrophota bacterium]